MRPVIVAARVAISAQGHNESATHPGFLGHAPVSSLQADPELIRAGFRRPVSGRIRGVKFTQGGDRATELLVHAAAEFRMLLDATLPQWRTERLGLALSTSAGGMPTQEKVFSELRLGVLPTPEWALGSLYFGPISTLTALLGCNPIRTTQVLAACVGSTVALGIACRWLEFGCVDWVIAGGYDVISTLVAAGFEALGATTASHPNPFRLARDGMALGEGVGLVLLGRLERRAALRTPPLGVITGFGISCDAQHITAPDRSGAGLARAAHRALADALLEPEEIELISAHATATLFNDSAESLALQRVFGNHADRLVVHPFKAVIGHTLGAAGVLESLAALQALELGVQPAALGQGPLDPVFPARLLERAEPGQVQNALKLSSAFGGANAALVLAKEADKGGRKKVLRPVYLVTVGRAVRRVEQVQGVPPCLTKLKVEQVDPLSGICLAACAALDDWASCPESALNCGVVVGSAGATLEANAQFFARILASGLRAAEPRRFPATSPSTCAGQCSIGWGLRGPSMAVASSPAAALEALCVAVDWVAAGDADSMVVIAAEWVASVVSAVWGALGWPEPEPGALAIRIAANGPGTLLYGETLWEFEAEARANKGEFRGAAPGWPSLAKVLGTLA